MPSTVRSTGAAAHVLDTTEPRLADLVRRGKVVPAPEVHAGRRQWTDDQILAAAVVLRADLEAVGIRLGIRPVDQRSPSAASAEATVST